MTARLRLALGARSVAGRLPVLIVAVALLVGAAGVRNGALPVRTAGAGLATSPGSATISEAISAAASLGGGRNSAGPATAGPPRLLGLLDPSATVDFAFALRMPGQAAIKEYLASLYDPSSPNYRHFLSAAEFGARFGLPLSRIARLESWARAAGLTVLGGYDQRTALRLRATAGGLGRIFGLRLGSYFDPKSGLTYHAPLNAASVPAEIADAVVGLAGLNTRPFTSAVRPMAAAPKAVPFGAMGPVDLAVAYDIVPLYEAGFLGDGQTVAVVSFDTYLDADIAAFDKEYGIDGPAVKRVAVGNPVTKPGNGSIEVTLDVEILREVAPHAQILNFEGINGKISQSDVFDAIVQDGRADIVSDSWGRCDTEDSFNVGDRERGVASLQAATANGISIFVASGDNGVFDCWARDSSDQRQTVDYPSASPYTISVGGTHLDVRADGTYLSEAGWENYLSTAGTGGGLNPIDEIPAWQSGPGVDNDLSNGKRQSPDVAAAGDPETGYRIWFTEPGDKEGFWIQVGGTSAAAPFWAASMALIRQLALNKGVGRLGFVNPMLYELAAGPDAATIFHDVTRGGNLDQQAGPGWDYATGLGSPDVTALAAAVINYLNEHPVP